MALYSLGSKVRKYECVKRMSATAQEEDGKSECGLCIQGRVSGLQVLARVPASEGPGLSTAKISVVAHPEFPEFRVIPCKNLVFEIARVRAGFLLRAPENPLPCFVIIFRVSFCPDGFHLTEKKRIQTVGRDP